MAQLEVVFSSSIAEKKEFADGASGSNIIFVKMCAFLKINNSNGFRATQTRAFMTNNNTRLHGSTSSFLKVWSWWKLARRSQ